MSCEQVRRTCRSVRYAGMMFAPDERCSSISVTIDPTCVDVDRLNPTSVSKVTMLCKGVHFHNHQKGVATIAVDRRTATKSDIVTTMQAVAIMVKSASR